MNSLRLILAVTHIILCLQSGSLGAIISAYQFDETSGGSASDAVRGATGAGTLSNFSGGQWVPGMIGGALEFDGSDDFVLAPNVLPTGTSQFTISLWAWANSANTWGSLVKNWGETSPGAFHLGLESGTGRISNYLGTPQEGPILSTSALSLNAWHHIALTFNGATMEEWLYIDGVAVASFTTSLDSLTALGTNMAFGVKPNETTTGPAQDCCPGYWDGRIDDLVFFDTALTAAELGQITIDGNNGLSAIPEPTAVSLILFTMMGAAILRRRK